MLMSTKVTTRSATIATARGWQGRFLKAMCDLPNITHACEVARVSRNVAYTTRQNDKEFAKAWDDAIEAGIDSLEVAAMDRAKNGVARGIWMKDENGKIKKVETVRDYPDSLTQFLLKAHRPGKYREQRDVISLGAATVTPDGQRSEFVVHLSQEELP